MIYAPARFATRFLLPMEVLLSWFSLGWAWGGLFGQGVFGQAVKASGVGPTWMILVAVWAGCMFLAAAVESLFGRNWSDRTLRWSLEIRAHMGWLGLILWITVGVLMIEIEMLRNVLSMVWAMPAMLVGCASVGWHNTKVALILNPNVPTEYLKSRLLDERTRRPQRP